MINTPGGTRVLLFAEAELKEWMERELLHLFSLWGYSRITAPAVEYLDIAGKSLDDEGKKRIITFGDPSGGGRPMALRSDVTPQIARIASTMLKNRPAPLRLSYAETAYRTAAPGLGRRMEVYQAGVEMVGAAGPSADAEIMALGVESLIKLGFEKKDISLAISHIGYIEGLMNQLSLSTAGNTAVRGALLRKDTKGLDQALQTFGANGSASEAMKKAPSLFGGVGVIDKAPIINEATESAVKSLKSTLKSLGGLGLTDAITIDLGEVRGFGYYTGVTFEGFVNGVSRRALSGGRYDKLLEVYGRERPAIGFAVDVDHLLERFFKSENKDEYISADALVVSGEGGFSAAMAFAERLREGGVRAAPNVVERALAEYVEYAKKMKIKAVLHLKEDDTAGDIVKAINPITGEEKNVSVEDVIEELSNCEERRDLICR